MKSKPDDRRDNVEKIQKNINHTLQNIEIAEDMIAKIDHQEMKKDLVEKNEKRKKALHGMKEEIKEEAIDKRNGYH